MFHDLDLHFFFLAYFILHPSFQFQTNQFQFFYIIEIYIELCYIQILHLKYRIDI